MRRATRTSPSSPLIHVHVNEATPVHVHVKGCRMHATKSPQVKTKLDRGHRRPTATVKTRVPWIPPGKTSLRDPSYKWEGPTHHLEIMPPPPPQPEANGSHAALRLAELTSEEEEGLHGRISQYERKVDSLLTEVKVGSLKNEVELRKRGQLLERQSELLAVNQRAMGEREEQLAEVTRELEETKRENTWLRQSVEKTLEERDRLARDTTQQDKDALLRKLMEAEEDAAAAAQQVSALRESLFKVCGSSRPPDTVAHREQLLQKLEAFEATNRTLRPLLRDQGRSQMEWTRLWEQRDSLQKRLTDTEAENAFLLVKLQERENEVEQVSKRLDVEQGNAKSAADLTKSLESTRARLQGQLRSREAESNRLAVQVKNLERAAAQQKAEAELVREQLARQKEQSCADREALRQRAQLNEDAAGQLSQQLLDMEQQVSAALSAADTWKSRHAQELKDKSRLERDLLLLNSRLVELTEHLQRSEDQGQVEREALLGRLQALTTESAAARLQNQALKASAAGTEEKLASCQAELQRVKDSIGPYESLIDSYKIQVGKTRAEAEEYCALLARAEREAQAVRGELEQEVEEVRRELLGRLAELEPLPDTLRRTELQLQEAEQRERSQERRSLELSASLTELHLKVETQGSQLELLRQKNKVLLEENRQLQQRVETFERKLEERDGQNRDLMALFAKREDAIHSNQLRLEEKSRRLEEARQQVSESREQATAKERSTRAEMVNLEAQLSRTGSMIQQLRRSKGEVERRYQSRLQDMAERLEQSDSANRSLQNYVQFLKASYANVFGDVSISRSLQAPPPAECLSIRDD